MTCLDVVNLIQRGTPRLIQSISTQVSNTNFFKEHKGLVKGEEHFFLICLLLGGHFW